MTNNNSKPSARIASAKEALRDVKGFQDGTMRLSECLLAGIEELAEDAIASVGLPPFQMIISEESFNSIVIASENWLDEPNEDSFTYDGGTGGTAYHLGLHVAGTISENGTCDLTYQATLIAGTDDAVSRYDYDTGTWQEDPALKQVVDILNAGGAQGDYIEALANAFHADPLGISAGVLLNSLKLHGPLIRLYESLRGVASFAFETDRNNDIRPMLMPDDPLRHGSAVFYENGVFTGCQYLSEQEALEAAMQACSDDPDRADRILSDAQDLPLYREVFSEKSIRKTASFLRHWWDRYSPDDSYSLPLSGGAVVLTGNPYLSIPKPVTQHGPRDLTPTESKELGYLRKHFK